MRIGIVSEEAATARALRRWLSERSRHHVAWTAANGLAAVDLSSARTVDLVLMDLRLSEITASEATRRIMAASPCAILIVTDSVETNAAAVFEAMGSGALDAVDMAAPDAASSAETTQSLLVKIDRLSRLVNDGEGRQPGGGRAQGSPKSHSTRLVAIGASAGGPAAVATLLAGLPRHFPAAVVVIQHVDAQFARGLADWLGNCSNLPVRIAQNGDTPEEGSVLVAGAGDHLILASPERLVYSAEPGDHVYRPSIDVFFQSVCRLWRGDAVGVLLTGMGRDGALGLKALRDQGRHTIAQDEATSALYGMPKAAAALGAATEILPIDRIAPHLVEIMAPRPVLHRVRV